MKVSGKFDAPATLLLEKKPPVNNKLVGPRPGLDFGKKRKITCPSQESNHNYSGIQFIAYSLHQLHNPSSTLKRSLYSSLQP
jgi:hypothetical protein